MNILQQIEDSDLSGPTKKKVADLFTILAMHAREMTAEQLFKARTYAGLSLGQAAHLAGIPAGRLAGYESGIYQVKPNDAEALDAMYGLGVDLG